VAGDPYEIRIVPGRRTTTWRAVAAKVGSGGTTALDSGENLLSRVSIKSASGGEVQWSVRFSD